MKPDKQTPDRNPDLTGPYDRDACIECGECLMKCPALGLKRGDAQREIRDLRAGRPGRFVLRRCESCFACNLVCPQKANPAQLFLDAFHAELQRKGTPAWADYFQPHDPDNFRRFITARMPVAERRLIEKWADRSPCEEFVYPGCNIIAAPYLIRAWFLKDLNIRGGLDLCCGEMYYRTGMVERLEQQARRLADFVRELGAKRMMILCTAGYNLFTNILPRHGFDADIEITPYLPWLWEQIHSGGIPIVNKLNITATIQESCHAKIIGDEYMDLPRRILEACGVEVVEKKQNRDCAFCCGIGGGFPPGSGYHPVDVTRATLRVAREAARTRAHALVCYCAGCMQSLCAGMAAYPARMPVYHLFQVVQQASGEKPELRLNAQRGRLHIQGMLTRQVPKLLNPKRKPLTQP